MSISDLAKQALVAHYGAQGVDTKASQWKRRSKGPAPDHPDYVVRLFENEALGLGATVVTVDEDEIDDADDMTVWEDGPVGFMLGTHGDVPTVSFGPLSQWERSRTLPRLNDYNHIERGIEAIPIDWCGDGIDDNLFEIRDAEHVRRTLLAAGYAELDPDELKGDRS